MPEKSTIRRARKDASEGKAPTTQAGEFIREEILHIREGVHGARSAKQAIAVGLSKARRAGVALPPKPGTKALASGAPSRAPSSESSATRARVASATLRKARKSAASHLALARHAHKSAIERGPKQLHAAAMKAAATKGRTGLRKAAKRAAATRQHER